VEALPRNSLISLGAQDCHAQAEGAFTGDIAAGMLKEAGCAYVILGHSERRRDHGETDAVIAQKLNTAQSAGLIPILCIGETLAEYEGGKTAEVLKRQLALIKADGTLIIAYEPVWAIGSGKTPKPAEIQAAHAVIKTVLGRDTPVLYGGSVNAANLAEIVAIPEVSGVLVGGASRDLAAMLAMIDIMNGN
jgi:triosephosphate isomerase